MAAKGPEVAFLTETSGVLGVSTLSPEAPLLEPSPRETALSLDARLPLCPWVCPVDGATTPPRWTWGRVRHWNEGEGLDQEPSFPGQLPQHLTGS